MARKEIKVKILGLETTEDREAFYQTCANAWMGWIGDAVNSLNVSYEKKVQLVSEVVDSIHRRVIEGK